MTTAAEVRERGDASPAERAELRELIARKVVTEEWKETFYADVIQDGGLSSARAKGALNYLRKQADRSVEPVYATREQEAEIRELVRVHLAPAPWRQTHMVLLETGKLTFIQADQFIGQLKRLPKRRHVPPAGPVASAGNFPDGYYAIRTTGGEVRKYRVVDRGGLREVWRITGFKAGQRCRIRGREAVDIIQCISADPAGAARLWAEVSKRCSACNTDIKEDPKNPGFPHGFGPDCWKKEHVQQLVNDTKAAIADRHPQEPAA